MNIDYYSLLGQMNKSRQELKTLIKSGSAILSKIEGNHKSSDRTSIGEVQKTLIITPNEINLFHGTGVLLNRIYHPSDVIAIRSREDYAEKGAFLSSVIRGSGCSRAEIFSLTIQSLSNQNIKSILCVPYYREDYLIAIAAKSILDVPISVWIMDDSIIHQREVPHDIARELFNLADVRFAISPAMRDTYERDFQVKFHMLPPTVPSKSLKLNPKPNFRHNLENKVCAMVGNIWGDSWLKSLGTLVKDSGWTVHWFGKGSSCGWLNTTPERLQEMNIVEKGYVPENELPEILASYPFVLLPTGTGDENDDRKGVTLLSLPTRMPFLLSVVRIPMLVIGSTLSSSTDFIKRFGVGLNCEYNLTSFISALRKMSEERFNMECRENCTKAANIFSDDGLAQWIQTASERRCVSRTRFECYFKRSPTELISYIDETPPKELYGDFKLVYSAMSRIANQGYRPDFVLDVGGSSGVWSDAVHRVYPLARFVLIEPLPDRYPNWFRNEHPDFEWIATAASNKDGNAVFQVSNDLYGSSLFHPEDNRDYQSVDIPVITLDTLLKQKKLQGRGIVKIDVQFAEHLVLDGAVQLLKQVDFLVIELTLMRGVPEARTFLEMIVQLENDGFQYFDDVGDWRNPVSGLLEQKDVIFVNKEIAKKIRF